MKKEEIVAALDGIKNMTSVVSIHSILEMLEKMEPEVRVEKVLGFSQEVADELFNRIEKSLDYNSDDLVDTESATFEISYNNQIELSSANINVYDTMKHIEACLDEFVMEAEEEVEDEVEAELMGFEGQADEEDMTFSREEDDTLNEAPYEINDHVFIERADDNGEVEVEGPFRNSPDRWGTPASINAGGTMDNEMS